MAFAFEKLHVYQKAIDFSDLCDRCVEGRAVCRFAFSPHSRCSLRSPRLCGEGRARRWPKCLCIA